MTETPETSQGYASEDQDAEPTSTAPDEGRPQRQPAENPGVDDANRSGSEDSGQTEA